MTKGLLLDTHIANGDALPRSVLTGRIDKKRDRMAHMKCVCFLQPSEDSLEALAAELREPE